MLDVFPSDPAFRVVTGVIAVIAGIGIASLSLRFWARSVREDERHESFLAPILAADALPSDLRILYARTMVLDAEAETSASSHARRLGRELRRLIIAFQAVRCEAPGHASDAEDLAGMVERASEALSTNAGEGAGAVVADVIALRRQLEGRLGSEGSDEQQEAAPSVATDGAASS